MSYLQINKQVITLKKYLIDNKELMKEWDYEKNINLDSSNITLGVHKLVWWI